MRLQNNKSGFTLLEIIIVIIIVGVLASLALPRFFKTIEFARSTEGMTVLGEMKRGADRCSIMSGTGTDYTDCLTPLDVGFEDPGPNAHFSYTMDGTGVTGPTTGSLIFIATRLALDGGNPGDTITLTLDVSNGTVTKQGTGAFAGIK